MLIESIIRRPKGTKIDLGRYSYHFLPDEQGRHVAEVDNETDVANLLAIKEGFRPADGSMPPSLNGMPLIDGPYFIVTGPQDMLALAQWCRVIPDMDLSPHDLPELISLGDKVAVGEAQLGGYRVPDDMPTIEDLLSSAGYQRRGATAAREPSPPAPPTNSIIPIDQSQPASPGSNADGLKAAGDGGTGAVGGAGADTATEEGSEDDDDDASGGDLDREALAKQYDELVGHRPNGKWKAQKIAEAIAELQARG